MSETEYALGRNCGITYAGIKPASMVSISGSGRQTAKQITDNFIKKGFSAEELKRTDDKSVLLVYGEVALKEVLFSKENKEFLKGYGYNYSTVSEAVETLKSRMKNKDFPHEIGVFLGYALDDVKGFIESPCKGVKVLGYWKVYSDEKSAIEKFSRYKKCSDCITRRMECGESLSEIFKVG